MVPSFSKAALQLKVGSVTMAPVKTQYGYHVIYLDDKKEAKEVVFEEEKERIITILKQ